MARTTARRSRRATGCASTTVRYSNVYGPGQRPDNPYCGVVSKFLVEAHAGRPITIHGDGEQTRDYTYIDDAVEATLLAAVHPRAEGEVFNVGTGIETSVNRLAASIGEALEVEVDLRHVDRRDIDNIRRRVVNIEKIRRMLRWTPAVDARPRSRRDRQLVQGVVVRDDRSRDVAKWILRRSNTWQPRRATHWWFVGRRAVIDALLEGMALPISGDILEAGCGTGGNPGHTLSGMVGSRRSSHTSMRWPSRGHAIPTSTFARVRSRGALPLRSGSIRPGRCPRRPGACRRRRGIGASPGRPCPAGRVDASDGARSPGPLGVARPSVCTTDVDTDAAQLLQLFEESDRGPRPIRLHSTLSCRRSPLSIASANGCSAWTSETRNESRGGPLNIALGAHVPRRGSARAARVADPVRSVIRRRFSGVVRHRTTAATQER